MVSRFRSRVWGHAATALLVAAVAGCSVSALPSADPASEGGESPTGSEASQEASRSTIEPSPAPSPEPSTSEPSPDPEPTATPDPDPTPTPDPTPSPTPSESQPEPSSALPTPTPWPFATITGIGHLDGRPFTIDVWIDHEGGAHGLFDGSVAGEAGPLQVTGPVTCAWIDENIGVVGGRADWTDFVVMVSDRPNGMIIGTGRPDCDIAGFGDPASSPTTDGDIHVIPEP